MELIVCVITSDRVVNENTSWKLVCCVTFGFLARQRFDDLKIDVEDAIDGECAHINDVKLMTKIKSWRV